MLTVRRWIPLLLILAILAPEPSHAFGRGRSKKKPKPLPTPTPTYTPPPPPPQPGNRFKKAFVVVFENTNADVAMSRSFFSHLAATGASLTNYFGITHPSQPNYIGLTSGTRAVTTNDVVNLNLRHIGDLLEERGKSWKSYASGFPGNCFLGETSGRYARKHEPFISYTNVNSNPARCARVVDSSQLDVDLANGNLADFSLFVPNLDEDAHDTSIDYANTFLQQRFGPLLNDRRFMQDMLFVVIFDESGNATENRVAALFYGDSVVPGSTSNMYHDHFSLLRTLERELGLGSLGQEDGRAIPIDGIWK